MVLPHVTPEQYRHGTGNFNISYTLLFIFAFVNNLCAMHHKLDLDLKTGFLLFDSHRALNNLGDIIMTK